MKLFFKNLWECKNSGKGESEFEFEFGKTSKPRLQISSQSCKSGSKMSKTLCQSSVQPNHKLRPRKKMKTNDNNLSET